MYSFYLFPFCASYNTSYFYTLHFYVIYELSFSGASSIIAPVSERCSEPQGKMPTAQQSVEEVKG